MSLSALSSATGPQAYPSLQVQGPERPDTLPGGQKQDVKASPGEGKGLLVDKET